MLYYRVGLARLAVVSAIIAFHLRISIALVEICVGVAAGAVAAVIGKSDSLGSNLDWLRFLASTGAVLLTFWPGPNSIHRSCETK